MITEEVGVAEVDPEVEFEEIGTTDDDPDPAAELGCLVAESAAPVPDLLPPDCVALLACVFEASVVVVGVVDPSLLCICTTRGSATAIAMQR